VEILDHRRSVFYDQIASITKLNSHGGSIRNTIHMLKKEPSRCSILDEDKDEEDTSIKAVPYFTLKKFNNSEVPKELKNSSGSKRTEGMCSNTVF